MRIVRGDIIYIDLGQHAKSSVQSGMRPCVVVSNDKANRESKVINVCPLTSRQTKKNIPTHVAVAPEDVKGYLESTSTLLAEQITTVDKCRVISKVGHIEAESELMDKISQAVSRQLDGSLK